MGGGSRKCLCIPQLSDVGGGKLGERGVARDEDAVADGE
jgi:hypothetical protein